MEKLNKRQFNKLFSMILNLLIVFFAASGFVLCYFHWGWRLLTFYTEFSNFFAMITGTIVYIYQLKDFRENKPMPYWVKLLKYFSTCCLALTFFVVLFILAPGSGKGGFYTMFISGSSLYFHFLNPILAMVSLIFFEREQTLKKNSPELALIPTFLYAIVMYPLIVVEKVTPPYPFLDVYAQPLFMTFIWFLILLASAFIFNFALYFVSTNNVLKHNKKKH